MKRLLAWSRRDLLTFWVMSRISSFWFLSCTCSWFIGSDEVFPVRMSLRSFHWNPPRVGKYWLNTKLCEKKNNWLTECVEIVLSREVNQEIEWHKNRNVASKGEDKSGNPRSFWILIHQELQPVANNNCGKPACCCTTYNKSTNNKIKFQIKL